jgi:hypothetical protein
LAADTARSSRADRVPDLSRSDRDHWCLAHARG